jgi:hypothetical protein
LQERENLAVSFLSLASQVQKKTTTLIQLSENRNFDCDQNYVGQVQSLILTGQMKNVTKL